MKEKNIEHLLYNAGIIQKKYNELAEITGEYYNVFDILGTRISELSHSSILSNLLNAKGKHGQKDLFLKLFIEIIKNEFIADENKMQFFEDFKTEISKAETEKFAGKISFEDGGRIDIIICQGNQNIIIENKINAGDQNLQLIRYNNFDKKSPILYLTLDGKDASEKSRKDLKKGKDYICISYQTEIIFWIEKCIEKMANKPFIRETLNQYLILIKSLTNQSTNNKMSEEIKELIKRDFASAKEIVNNYEKAKDDICTFIRDNIKIKLESELGLEYDISYKGSYIGNKNSKIFLELRKYIGLNIFFGIEPFSGNGGIGNELFLGILDIEQKNKLVFEKHPDFKKGWWVHSEKFNQFEEYSIDFSNPNFLNILGKNKDKQIKLATELAKQIINYIKIKEPKIIKICEEIMQKT